MKGSVLLALLFALTVPAIIGASSMSYAAHEPTDTKRNDSVKIGERGTNLKIAKLPDLTTYQKEIRGLKKSKKKKKNNYYTTYYTEKAKQSKKNNKKNRTRPPASPPNMAPIPTPTMAPTPPPTMSSTKKPTDPPTSPPTPPPTSPPTMPPTPPPTMPPTPPPTMAPTRTPTDPPTSPPTGGRSVVGASGLTFPFGARRRNLRVSTPEEYQANLLVVSEQEANNDACTIDVEIGEQLEPEICRRQFSSDEIDVADACYRFLIRTVDTGGGCMVDLVAENLGVAFDTNKYFTQLGGPTATRFIVLEGQTLPPTPTPSRPPTPSPTPSPINSTPKPTRAPVATESPSASNSPSGSGSSTTV